jgi:hypothetical protein
MAEDIVTSHPLLITRAIIYGECVEKLKILRKKLFNISEQPLHYILTLRSVKYLALC